MPNGRKKPIHHSLRTRYSLLSVEDLARAASLYPEHLEKFAGFGLVEHTVRTRSSPLFRRSSLERLRRIHRLRRDRGINLAGIAAVWTSANGDDASRPAAGASPSPKSTRGTNDLAYVGSGISAARGSHAESSNRSRSAVVREPPAAA
jgi:DNA-binding transcriptional MerR regulator